MERAAAFRASYSDWKLIKTRATVQIVLEVPVEQADEAYSILGGMPQTGNERWVAVAMLSNAVAGSPPPATDRAAGGASTPVLSAPAARSFAQQAGILCNDPKFHRFLEEMCSDVWRGYAETSMSKDEVAKHSVYKLCGVLSRSELKGGTPAGLKWVELHNWYQAWLREPEVVS